MSAKAAFESIIETFAGDAAITRGRMFGAPALKVGNKVFAYLARGKLVVKLPTDRVEAIVSSGQGQRFDPGYGRIKKQWVAVPEDARTQWLELAREAKGYVAPTS